MVKKISRFILLFSLSFLLIGTVSYAEPTEENKDEPNKQETTTPSGGGTKFVIDNDGKERKEPIGDSKLPVSFKDCKYYDAYVPYKLTAKQIGGWTHKPTGNSNYTPMSDFALNAPQGSLVAAEGAIYGNPKFPKLWKYLVGHVTKSTCPDTGLQVLTDKYGTQYYVTAVQKFFFNSSVAGTDGFPKFSMSGYGSLIDVILTDGTVIHFVYGDSNAAAHTNGGGEGGPAGDGVYHHKPMILNQYKNLFSSVNGNQLEIWGDGSYKEYTKKFREKFNLGTGADQNKIAYYRMYNKKILDPPEPVNEAVKKVSYKLGDVSIQGGGSSSTGGTSQVAGAGLFAETHFVSWKEASDPPYEIPSLFDLPKEQDIADVEIWKQDLEHSNKDTFLVKFGRWLCLLFGIMFEIWMMLLYLSYWFDRINNFVEIELLKVVSFGRLTISPDESECTFRVKNINAGEARTVNHKTILVVCLIGLFFGTFVVSGGLFKTLNRLVTFVLKLF